MTRTYATVAAALLISTASFADSHGKHAADTDCLAQNSSTSADDANTREGNEGCSAMKGTREGNKPVRKRPPYLVVTTYNTQNGNNAGEALIFLDQVAYFLRDGDRNATHVVFSGTSDSFSIGNLLCEVEEAIRTGKRELRPYSETGGKCE